MKITKSEGLLSRDGQQNSANRILMFDHQQACGMGRAEKQLTESGRIHPQPHGHDPRCVTDKQSLHMAVKTLGSVVRQEQQPRDSPPAGRMAVLIGQSQSALLGSQFLLRALQTARDPAGSMCTAQGQDKGWMELELRDLYFCPLPQGPGVRGQDAKKLRPPGILLDQLWETNRPGCLTHVGETSL
jgi:hypothetical protein